MVYGQYGDHHVDHYHGHHDHHHVHDHDHHDHHHVHHHLRPSVIQPHPAQKAQTLVLTRKQDALHLHFDEHPGDDDDCQFNDYNDRDDDYYAMLSHFFNSIEKTAIWWWQKFHPTCSPLVLCQC